MERNKKSTFFYLYINLIAWLNITPITNLFALNAITNIVDIKYKINYLKVDLPENLFKDLNFYIIFSIKIEANIIYDMRYW